MNVTCPECRSVFRVDPAKIPASGVRARCSVCGGTFAVTADRARGTPAEASRAVTPNGAPRAGTPAAPLPSIGAAPAAPRHGEAPAVAPSTLSSTARTTPTTPVHAVPTAPSPAAPPAPAMSAPAAPSAPVDASSSVRRPVNPYLSNDPGQKARRLARALVSDLIAYHPQKREEGLRAGTLKQLFRDEIRKSWEEYVEQIGAPLAESTPHFQDALNDLLAGGRKVF